MSQGNVLFSFLQKKKSLLREKKAEMLLGIDSLCFLFPFQVVLLTEGLNSRAVLMLELNTSLETLIDKVR